jgi:hypothetical protein
MALETVNGVPCYGLTASSDAYVRLESCQVPTLAGSPTRTPAPSGPARPLTARALSHQSALGSVKAYWQLGVRSRQQEDQGERIVINSLGKGLLTTVLMQTLQVAAQDNNRCLSIMDDLDGHAVRPRMPCNHPVFFHPATGSRGGKS